jgi:2-polyprenyl-3-methyl-5-hydroxy-6-metoxy-1,4-benzoquinol methylase
MILRKYRIINNVFVFDENPSEKHPDYHADGLDVHQEFENKLFWFIARKEFLLSRFRKYIDEQSKGIDIGAGTGNLTGYLISKGYDNISVGEMHWNGLEYASRYVRKSLYQFDIRKVTFDDEFDFVCLFDLLEHIEEEEEKVVLHNVHRMLHKGNGKIIITVPAHQWLWSLYDNVARHKRRYTKKHLKEKLRKSGFEIIEMKYFFMFITPLLFIRVLRNPDRGRNYDGYRAEDSINNPFINKVLLWLCRLENKFIDWLPNIFGGSLYVVAQVEKNRINNGKH